MLPVNIFWGSFARVETVQGFGLGSLGQSESDWPGARPQGLQSLGLPRSCCAKEKHNVEGRLGSSRFAFVGWCVL